LKSEQKKAAQNRIKMNEGTGIRVSRCTPLTTKPQVRPKLSKEKINAYRSTFRKRKKKSHRGLCSAAEVEGLKSK